MCVSKGIARRGSVCLHSRLGDRLLTVALSAALASGRLFLPETML